MSLKLFHEKRQYGQRIIETLSNEYCNEDKLIKKYGVVTRNDMMNIIKKSWKDDTIPTMNYNYITLFFNVDYSYLPVVVISAYMRKHGSEKEAFKQLEKVGIYIDKDLYTNIECHKFTTGRLLWRNLQMILILALVVLVFRHFFGAINGIIILIMIQITYRVFIV